MIKFKIKFIFVFRKDNKYKIETLYRMLKETYIHPSEKNLTHNPIQIWNDSYSHIKRAEERPQKQHFEYENIIIRKKNEDEDDIINELF